MTKEIHDVAEFKALAHPLRVHMLAALREHGPATATELAARFDTDTGATSYHLRKLAAHGFIEEIPAEGHPRARRWQAVHKTSSWDPAEMSATAEGREAAAFMRRTQAQVLLRDIESFEDAQWSHEWVQAAGIGDVVATLTPAALQELWDRFYAHLDELNGRDEGGARVSIVVSGFPKP